MTLCRRAFAVLVVMTVLAASPVVVRACPVCFRMDDAATTSGVYAAVYVLLGVITGVLGGFVVFIVQFVRRARGLAVSGEDAAP